MEARGPRSYSNPQSHSGSLVARCILQIAVSFLSRIGPSLASSHAASPAAVFSNNSAVALSAGASCSSANASQYRNAAFRVSGGSFDCACAVAATNRNTKAAKILIVRTNIFTPPVLLFLCEHAQRACTPAKIRKDSLRGSRQFGVELFRLLQRQFCERQQGHWLRCRFRVRRDDCCLCRKFPARSLLLRPQPTGAAKPAWKPRPTAKRAACAAQTGPNTLQISCRHFPFFIAPFSCRSCGRSFSRSFSSAYLYRDATVLRGAPDVAAISSNASPPHTRITTTSRCSSGSSASA